MESQVLAIVALLILAFGLVSGRLQNSVITPPMVFVTFGLVVSPAVLGLVDLDIGNELVRALAELTLILVLFTDAARINLNALRRDYHLPLRLLGISLPLTIAFGTLLGAVLFDYLAFWEAAVVAAVLAPTDAALGQTVVSNPRVPVRIRQALNVESGLNDGLALPIVLVFLAMAGAAEDPERVGFWANFTARQIVLGPLVGVGVGYLGGRLVYLGTRTEWMNHSFQQLSALALSLLAFALAELVGGNGFIAAFTAGLTIGNTSRQVCGCLYEFAEAEGQLLALLTFMIFGGVMVWPTLEHLNWLIALYGALGLAVVRMLAVAFSLIGAGLQPDTFLFLGWFGPRGLASIVFGLLALERANIDGRDEIFAIVIATVVLSVFAHGVTALPGTNWYTARAEEMKAEPDMAEFVPVTEMPVRIPYRG